MASPLLRYQFSSINNGQITDFGSGIESTIHGGCTIVTDSVMGPCLNFNGTTGYVSLGPMNFNFSQGFTLTCWVNFEKLNNFSHIVDFSESTSSSSISLSNQAETDTLVLKNCINTSATSLTSSKALGTNEWLHLAVTIESTGKATFYVDGIQSATLTNKSLCPINVNRTLNFLGKSNTAGSGMFQGKMSWMSMYDEVLNSDDILQEMNLSLVERGAFRSSLPVDFTLETNHQGTMAPVIFLESAATPETLFLTVKNASSSTLLLSAPQASSPSDTNYHFQLRFRPGVLSPKFVSNGKVTVKAIDGSTSTAWQAEPGLDS
ncbi:hypothetical protein A9Q81_12960 [Gammaproteobacteria bacterium 42_54_T18]|nr:hypothetical protein A9Q81_12960 [Gammaproteobacteria bacterium 42_54_T18]